METTSDGTTVVLGMGDGSMTTLTIADPNKSATKEYLSKLPSRMRGQNTKTEVYLQNGIKYPSPHDYSIYTEYLKSLHTVIPGAARR